MFGYIKPCKPELLIKEYETYKSIYCGLCKALGKEYGFISRFFLSYDITFLVALSMSLSSTHLKTQKKCCTVNPLKKCMFCVSNNDSYSFSSAVLIFMTYYKIKDDIHDSGFFKKIGVSFLLIFILKSFKKAGIKYPELKKIFSEYIYNQSKIENENYADIDLSAKPTADMMSAVFSILPNRREKDVIILEQLGFYLGRWIYLIDAADDFHEDLKNGNFNPFVQISKDKGENINIKEYKNSVLNLTLSRIISAYNLLNPIKFDSILRNILNLGMPLCQKQVIFNKEISHNKGGLG